MTNRGRISRVDHEPSDRFLETVLEEYARHRWPRVRTSFVPPSLWTKGMEKIVDKTARSLDLVKKRREQGLLDFTWYRRNSPIPAMVGEHEDDWKDVFTEEIPKLMASNAELKVLICYPPPARQEKFARRLLELLKRSDRVRELKEEFLLIMARKITVRDWKGFSLFWFHQDYVATPLSRFSKGQEVYWDLGEGLAYLTRVLDVRGSRIKVRVVDRGVERASG